MCAIVGSFDIDKLLELVSLNAYRGQHSYSISEYDVEEFKLKLLKRSFGEFTLDGVSLSPNMYYIVHTQAPTTEAKSIDNIHPSIEAEECMLWHNGIIKQDCVKWLQEEVKMPNEKWDTKLLHQYLRYGKDLSEINGTFSCLWYQSGLIYLFRNEISPMFIDDNMTISSTKFAYSRPTPPNEFLYMNFEKINLESQYSFKTKENPYYF